MAKKSFKDTEVRENPALSYMTAPSITQAATIDPAPAKEAKTKRVALTIRPTLHDGLSILARMYGKSVNELISESVSEYLSNHKTDLERGREFFGR